MICDLKLKPIDPHGSHEEGAILIEVFDARGRFFATSSKRYAAYQLSWGSEVDYHCLHYQHKTCGCGSVSLLLRCLMLVLTSQINVQVVQRTWIQSSWQDTVK